MQLAGVSALAFAVGVYLPLSTTLPIFCGGMVRAVVDHYRKMTPEQSDRSPAVLMASGLIAGASLAGVLLTLREVDFAVGRFMKTKLDLSSYLPAGWIEDAIPAIIAFAVVIAALLWVGLSAKTPAAIEPASEGASDSEQLSKG
jgi:hypothetical protein